MLPQPLTGLMDGVGEILKTNPLLQGTARLLKFLRTAIFLTAESYKETVSYDKNT